MYHYQIIQKTVGNYEIATDLVHTTLKKIRQLCKNGSVHALETILKSLEPHQLDRYLNAMIADNRSFSARYYTPLMFASIHGHDSIVRFLLQNYSHYCLVDAENYCSEYDDEDDCVIDYFPQQTALWFAVNSKHLDVVRTLISVGKAKINQNACYTLLHLACMQGQLEMIKYLIENDADLYHVDKNDTTALMIAASHNHTDVVEYLLSLDNSNHCLLNAVDKEGSTALHKAASARCINIVKLLLEKHHTKIIKNNEGHTPLTEAGINNDEELVRYFIENENHSWYTLSEVIDEFELIGYYHLP